MAVFLHQRNLNLTSPFKWFHLEKPQDQITLRMQQARQVWWRNTFTGTPDMKPESNGIHSTAILLYNWRSHKSDLVENRHHSKFCLSNKHRRRAYCRVSHFKIDAIEMESYPLMANWGPKRTLGYLRQTTVRRLQWR